MDDKVIRGPLALTDLEQIVRYTAAGRLGTRLPDQAETLCRLPIAAARCAAAPACANWFSGPVSFSEFAGQVLRR